MNYSLVVGGNGKIGREIVQVLSEYGRNVIVVDLENNLNYPPEILQLEGDINNDSFLESMREKIESLVNSNDSLEIINCAVRRDFIFEKVTSPKVFDTKKTLSDLSRHQQELEAFFQYPIDEFRGQWETNLLAVHRTIRILLPLIIRIRKCTILNIH